MHRFTRPGFLYRKGCATRILKRWLPSSRPSSSPESGVEAPNVPANEKPSESYWYPKNKADAMVGPRFEYTDMTAQPKPMSAIDLIDQQAVKKVHHRIVACDGGVAAGHPRVYINLDQPGAHACGYCGLRFELEKHH